MKLKLHNYKLINKHGQYDYIKYRNLNYYSPKIMRQVVRFVNVSFFFNWSVDSGNKTCLNDSKSVNESKKLVTTLDCKVTPISQTLFIDHI